MKKNNRKKQDSPLPPLVIIRGRQEAAVYREQQVPEFTGNPLIESLPPLWTLDEVTKLLAYSPPHSEEQRTLPSEVRLHILENAREFFITQTPHLEIHLSLSNMIRRGYVQRNPALRGSSQGQQERIRKFMAAHPRRNPSQSKARGFSIVGPGGMGKSTAVENYLSLYPQVIVHTKYHDEDFLLKQLVWLKLECPREGSIKSLCIHFFLTVDDILGTNYYEKYGTGRRTLDELLAGMIRVASWHYLGLLSVDEIQNLSEAKSGGVAKMINFFVQLENTIGVPFNLIGTSDAHRLLMGRFRQARRACEQGAILWQRMKEIDDGEDESEDEATVNGQQKEKAAPVWEVFVRALWDYQYLRTPQPLAEDLLKDSRAHALYEESQGITGVAVTLYFLAQRRAIVRGGEERLTAGVIRTVAKENQHIIKPMLDSLKAGITRGPYVVPDLVEAMPQIVPTVEEESNTHHDDKGQRSHNDTTGEASETHAPAQAAAAPAGESREPEKNPRPAKRKGAGAKKAPPPTYEQGDLRNIASQIAGGASVGEALGQEGYARPEEGNFEERAGA